MDHFKLNILLFTPIQGRVVRVFMDKNNSRDKFKNKSCKWIFRLYRCVVDSSVLFL